VLTALIIHAVDLLGAAVGRAEGRVSREDLAGRWRAIAVTTRRWARADPHRYAWSTAPRSPAAPRRRTRWDAAVDKAADKAVDAAVAPAVACTGGRVPTDLAVRGIMAWTHEEVRRLAGQLGIAGS